MFTEGLPLGKRQIDCGPFQITCVSFLPDSEKIPQTVPLGAWTDSSVCIVYVSVGSVCVCDTRCTCHPVMINDRRVHVPR